MKRPDACTVSATRSLAAAGPILSELHQLRVSAQLLPDLVELGKAFRILNAARSRVREIEQTAEREHERVRQWAEDETAGDRRTIAAMEQQIGACCLARRESSEERDTTFTTPWGRVSTRTEEPEYTREDDLLRPWAEEHGYTRVPMPKPVVDWKRIQNNASRVGRHLVIDGEIVPGVVIADPEPAVEVVPWE